ncbi:Zn(II)2Cys6 transcription factor [Aspergillus stella-maris]|uniref:Zn(II)2Cys6 transcription factor n=1 Tax=Aspergillus stella-maris TaxID=1810926 RepID=UPI003CCCBB85
MKAATACQQCRLSKRKCIRLGPGQACNACQQRGIKCSGKLQAQDDNSSAPTPSEPGESILSLDMSVELVELYLEKIHDRPHSLFHPATLRTQLRDGTAGDALVFAICAIGSKFSAYPDRLGLEKRLAGEAKRLLQADIENICIRNIQTCILIATLSAGNCETTPEALYFRIATSMAEIMDLNASTMTGSAIDREIVRRIWCSLYFADRWCFSGLGLRRHMDEFLRPSCSLPMDEMAFRSLQLGQTVPANVPWKPGIWTHMTMLTRYFGPIQDLNRRVARDDIDATELGEAVEQLGNQLEAWSEALPTDMQMTVQNLHTQQQNIGGPFVALHLTYHHYSTLLYFQFLESQSQSPPSNSTSCAYADRCKEHALSFSSLLHLSRQIKGCETNYPTVGHMVTVSSSVLLHTLALGDLSELEGARRALNANFELLIELQQYWPATSAMIKRLIAFQNLCLLSTESHRLDGWMVRFLLEHSRPLGKRELPCLPTNVDAEAESIASKTREWMQLGRYMDLSLPETRS